MNGTSFQKRVWDALRQVPAGKTATYAEIAVLIGSPAAVRAVGAANGANPVAVVVPCHRIIGSNGTLTGYGGGLKRKEWLLRHEGGRLFCSYLRVNCSWTIRDSSAPRTMPALSTPPRVSAPRLVNTAIT